jgi:hypothetical protein
MYIPEFCMFLIFMYLQIKTCLNSVRSSIIAKARAIVGQLYSLDECSSDDQRLEKVLNLLKNDTFIWVEEDREKPYNISRFGPCSQMNINITS